MKLPVYLDYASTTPVDPRVVEKMIRYLTLNGIFGNPSSRTHYYGWQAENVVEIARQQIAELIGAHANEIIFTSGATESINLAIKGIAQAYCHKGKHVITSAIEHKSVLNTCQYLKNQGFKITYITPNYHGLIDLHQIQKALCDETILLSIMHVNNEIGIIQDIEAFGKFCQYNDIIFHVDAAQSVGKLHIDLSNLSIDLMSFSAHKLYGPKGIGGLYIKNKDPKISIEPQMHGGGQEFNIRSGTLPVHQIVGMAEAFCLAKKEMKTEMIRLEMMRNRLWEGLNQSVDGVWINGSLNHSISTVLNVGFNNIDSETLMTLLKKDFALSSASACTTDSVSKISHVLLALGVDNARARNSIRFSLGRFTTEEEIEYTITSIIDTLIRLNKIIRLL